MAIIADTIAVTYTIYAGYDESQWTAIGWRLASDKTQYICPDLFIFFGSSNMAITFSIGMSLARFNKVVVHHPANFSLAAVPLVFLAAWLLAFVNQPPRAHT